MEAISPRGAVIIETHGYHENVLVPRDTVRSKRANQGGQSEYLQDSDCGAATVQESVTMNMVSDSDAFTIADTSMMRSVVAD